VSMLATSGKELDTTISWGTSEGTPPRHLEE
jgi:hypothetical protein